MRLPRWLQIMLLGTAAFTAGSSSIWWWIGWPRRTLQQFAAFVAEGQFDEATGMMHTSSRWVVTEGNDGTKQVTLEDGHNPRGLTLSGALWSEWCGPNDLQLEPRSAFDILRGRQPFCFCREGAPPYFFGGYAERGRIVMWSEEWAVSP